MTDSTAFCQCFAAVAALAALSAVGSINGTNVWNNAVGPGGNAPTNAYEWSDTKYWKDTSYVPGYWGDGAILGSPTTAPRFIRIPDLTRLTYISYSGKNHLLGNLYVGDDDDALTPGLRTSISGDTIIYGDLQPCSVRYVPYISVFAIAGRYLNRYNTVADRTPYSKPNYNASMGRTSTLTMRMDLWAESSNSVREAPFKDSGFDLANASFDFYGPRGADAQDSSWHIVPGSSYAQFAGTGTHGVVPGMVVTGTGIPTDGDAVYVKYVFTSTGWIELSAAATSASPSSAATLHFAAITPSVEQYFYTESSNFGGPHRIRAIKYRETDGCRLVFRDVVGSEGMSGRRWGLSASDVANGLIPGDIVISNTAANKISVSSSGVSNWLDVCRLEIPTAHREQSKLFWACGSECDARLTVRQGDAGVMPNFVSFVGKVEKLGAGSLTVKVLESESTGAVTVSEGTLVLTSVSGNRLTVASLTVKAGATLVPPAEGLVVKKLTLEPGAVVRGPGEVYFDLAPADSYAEGTVTLENGARVVLRGGISGARITTAPVANVTGHPAFWLDASLSDTITTNAAGEVTRWNDCREGEPMFCTNIVYAPYYQCGTDMTNKYVRLRKRSNTKGWVTNTECLVWSVPVKNVCTVFMMQDPTDGGGDFLGRTARLPNSYYASQGGPFYRGGNGWSCSIVYKNYGCQCVTNGWFYLNGTLVSGVKSGYLGTFMHLAEWHVNPDYPASSTYKELYIDAFGTGYGDGGLEAGSSGNYFMDGENGGQRIAECIVYTNILTYAERAQVAQYLTQKWLGKDAAWQEFDPRYPLDAAGSMTVANETVDVADGDVRMVSDTSGSGTLSKTGAGVLYLGAMPSGGLAVEAGEVIVNSLGLTTDSVPGVPWVHLDASTASTLETDESGGVTRWKDVRSDGSGAKQCFDGARKATCTPNVMNGRAVLDFGTASSTKTGGSGYRFYKSDGSVYHHTNEFSDDTTQYGLYIASDYIRDAFFTVGSKNGGGSLLGGWLSGYPANGTPHASKDPSAPILSCTANFWWAYGSLYNNISNGTTVARLNGAKFNPIDTPFSGGYDLISFQHLSRKSDSLCIYGQASSWFTGGLEYGEVLLYTNNLSDAEFAKVEAYLQKRWFNRLTPGLAAAEVSTLRVAEGALVTVRDGGNVSTELLAGEGTVSGDVTLEEGGVFEVAVDAQGIPAGPLTVNGTLILPASATLAFTGGNRLAIGSYDLAAATAIEGTLSSWTVGDPGKSRRAFLVVDGNRLVLKVTACGTTLILR